MQNSTGTIRNVRIPACLSSAPAVPAGPDDLLSCDLLIGGGTLADILPAGTAPAEMPDILDGRGRIVLPLFADIHTHLDKSFIWDRTPNPDGTFAGAIGAVDRDREAFWTPDDVQARMEFSLRCAWGHGTGFLRTHLDTMGAHGEAVWPLFRDMQARWAGRIALQAVSLVMLERYLDPESVRIAQAVAETPGGMLGAVIMHDNVTSDRLDALFGLAEEYGCDLDLHVDENGFPDGTALEQIAEKAISRRFQGKIVCGHCCSLSRQDSGRQKDIVARVRDSGIGIVSLPTCNLYLQDRKHGATPFWRGVTLVHELAAAGVPVMFASDNVRDPFFPYGDYDMLDVFSRCVRIAQLDSPVGNWPESVTTRPARWMGHNTMLRSGGGADFILTDARTMNEMLSRPGAGRRLMRDGQFIEPGIPDYDQLSTGQ
ncbi:cytosine deaminase [Acetobacter musti]|uniref:Cytosine deaminase n=1 Tax=Acetobacter musti TaxID=864732 RepID=A0ABX0JQE5_9PROT|nr:cytosine deaminase [Acetobacter musti]NHN84110.1 cytosine deaminase [Acetobacter musti]